MFTSLLNKMNKKAQGETVVFTIEGMHCTSCSLNIDMSLEDINGVLESSTNFAQGKTTVVYKPEVTTVVALQAKIKEVGYNAYLNE
jgi:Cu+-exporting ATPase